MEQKQLQKPTNLSGEIKQTSNVILGGLVKKSFQACWGKTSLTLKLTEAR